MSLEQARNFVRHLNLKNEPEWKIYAKSGFRPDNIPANPFLRYRDKGWLSYADFLGFNVGYVSKKPVIFLPFKKARKYVCKLKFRSVQQWKDYCKSGKKPENIPSNPYGRYNKFRNYKHWMGYRKSITPKRNFLPFAEARQFAHSLKLKNSVQWEEYCASGHRPRNVPASPNSIYINKGWVGYKDWLGTTLPSFESVRTHARSLNLNSAREWQNYCRSKKNTFNMPAWPNNAYKNDGWVSWKGFLKDLPVVYRDKKKFEKYRRKKH